MNERHIAVQSKDLPPCHRCGGELYLAASVPHPTLPGSRVVGLCPHCDSGDPSARGLLAYLAIHSTVQSDDDATFANLVTAWLDAISARVPDPRDQATDEQAWHDGRL